MQTNSKTSLNSILSIIIIVFIIVLAVLTWTLLERNKKRAQIIQPAVVNQPTQQPVVSVTSADVPKITQTQSEQLKLDRIDIFPTGDVVTAQPPRPTIAMKPIEISPSGLSFSTLALPFKNKYPFRNMSGKDLTVEISGAHSEEQTLKNNEVKYLDFTTSGSYIISFSELGKSSKITVD